MTTAERQPMKISSVTTTMTSAVATLITKSPIASDTTLPWW